MALPVVTLAICVTTIAVAIITYFDLHEIRLLKGTARPPGPPDVIETTAGALALIPVLLFAGLAIWAVKEFRK